jgi:8-oxo-dGTP pyrophosphatase MutT (NUDIX family)
MRKTHNLPPIDDETRRYWRRRRTDHSAGGVIYRTGAQDDWEIALIATRGGTRWQLPKGTCEPGETIEQTALREVREECGLAGRCEAHLGAIEYWYWDTHHRATPELVQKCVDFYLMQTIGGELSDASIEVDSVNWFTLVQAAQVLTYPSEREMVARAATLLAAPRNAQ